MPIKPDDLARYPLNWPQISQRIRDRSGGRCECKGECRSGHRGRCNAWQDQPHPVTRSKVVLTTAHMDQTPENCDPSNLKAFCQKCHFAYDADQHAATRARTRLAEQTAGCDPLFDLGEVR